MTATAHTVRPRVSVVVPAYNVADYLGACLESLTQQTERSLEIIVVDDGSSDDTRAVAEQWKSRDSRIVVLSTENRGGAAARNTGFERATGLYVALQDADDYSHCTRFKRQADMLDARTDLSFVGTWAKLVGHGGKNLGFISPPETRSETRERMQRQLAYVHASLMFRRELIDGGMRYDTALPSSHDWDMLARVSETTDGESIGEPLYFYRVVSGQLTQRHAVGGALRSVWAAENLRRRREGEAALALMPKSPTRADAVAVGLDGDRLDGSVLARFEHVMRMNAQIGAVSDNRRLADMLIDYRRDIGAHRAVEADALLAVYGRKVSMRTLRTGETRKAIGRLLLREAKYRAHLLKGSWVHRRWNYTPTGGRV